MVTRVVRERKLKDTGVWGSFCSVMSSKDEDKDVSDGFTTSAKTIAKKTDEKALKALKGLTDDDIQSVIQSIDRQEILRRIPPSKAPFLAPPARRSKDKPGKKGSC